MEYSTIAKKTEKERIEPVCVHQIEISSLSDNNIVNDRFRTLLIQEGSGTLEINGNQNLWISPCIVCLNETDSISITLNDSNKSVKAKVLFFHPKFIHKRLNFENIRIRGMDAEPEVIENRLILKPFISEKYSKILNHISPESAKRVDYLINAANTELTDQPSGWWPCRTRSYMTELFFLIAQLFEEEKNDDQAIELNKNISDNFKPILDYVMRLYNTKLTLDSIAKEFGTNRTSLNNLFKKETNMSAIAYIIDLRLRIAATMLSDTDLPVSEIAERTGYSDVTHFERLFKKKYNVTPATFRSNKKNKN